LLYRKPRIHGGDPGDVPARSVEADDKAIRNWVTPSHEHDRHRRGRGFGSERRGHAAGCRDGAHLPAYQIGRQSMQPATFTVRPTIFDRNVAAIDIASLTQPFAKSGDEFGVCFG
jgi:hypothetical protein